MNCLDSTFLVDLLDQNRRAHADARAWLAANRDVPLYASTFVLWEVLRGASRLDGVDAVEPLSRELDWLEPLPFTRPAAVEAAIIEAELREAGEEISAADYPIAGTARNAGATVVTSDPDFERVRGLDVERYAADR